MSDLKKPYSMFQIAPKLKSKNLTEIKQLEEETLKNLRSSKANNTLRAYKSDFEDFSKFCSKNGFSSLPTQPKIIALYITHLSKISKFSTLKRRIASIKEKNKSCISSFLPYQAYLPVQAA